MKVCWSHFAAQVAVAGLLAGGLTAQGYPADPSRSQIADTSIGDALPEEPLCKHAESPILQMQLCDSLRGRVYPSARNTVDNLLRSSTDDAKTLCEIDIAIVRAHTACVSSPGVVLSLEFQSLMRRLADKWRLHRNLDRADEIYERLYARSSAPQVHNPLWLWAGHLLQDWIRLKLDRGERQAALALIERRVQLGRQAYDSDSSRIMLGSLVRDLQFQAAILMELGLVDQSRAALQEVETLMARPLPDPMGKVWPSSYIVPKLRPVLEVVKQEVTAKVPGVRIDTSEARAPADHSFSLRIAFSMKQTGDGSSGDINVKLDCGMGFNSPPGIEIEDREGFRTCRSYMTQGSGDREQVLDTGPSIEVSLEDGEQVRHEIDEWAARTAAFFRGSTGSIVASLQP